MATELSSLYVTISAKGLGDLTKELDQLRAKLAQAKKPAEDMEAATRGLGNKLTQAKQPADGVGSAMRGLGLSVPLTPLAAGAAVLGIVMQAAHTAINAVDGLKSSMIGLARQGFEGTVELNRYNFAMKLISREVAGALVPVLNLMTDALDTVRRSLAAVGGTGQRMFAAILVGVVLLSSSISVLTLLAAGLVIAMSPILVAFFATAGALAAFAGAIYLAYQNSAPLRGAITDLRTAFAQLVQSLEPIGVVLLAIGQFILKAFIIDPLVRWIDRLTVALKILERVSNIVTRIAGIGSLKLPGSEKTSVSLNQTGTESAEGTFQRIQQAILQAGTTTNEEKQTNFLESIDAKIGRIEAFIEPLVNRIPPNPGQLIKGAAVGFADDMSFGGVMRRLR